MFSQVFEINTNIKRLIGFKGTELNRSAIDNTFPDDNTFPERVVCLSTITNRDTCRDLFVAYWQAEKLGTLIYCYFIKPTGDITGDINI